MRYSIDWITEGDYSKVGLYPINISHYIAMNTHHSEHESRDISSSEDRCKCPQCRSQLQIDINYKKPLSSIYLYRHLRKRQAPPIKKDINKDTIIKSKMLIRIEAQNKFGATPVKYKTDRSKEAMAGILPAEYHMVSTSQRFKITKDDRFVSELRRDRPKIRSNYEGDPRLAEVTQNLEAIKIVQRQTTPSAERARMDASPNGGNLIKIEQVKATMK